MARHVDLVETRWSSGYQERVAKVYRNGKGIAVRSGEPRYSKIVHAAPGAAGDPDKFLKGLADRYHGDYFFATKPHDDAECPFAHGDLRRFEDRSSK